MADKIYLPTFVCVIGQWQARRAVDRWEVTHSNFLPPPLLGDALTAVHRLSDVGVAISGGYAQVLSSCTLKYFLFCFSLMKCWFACCWTSRPECQNWDHSLSSGRGSNKIQWFLFAKWWTWINLYWRSASVGLLSSLLFQLPWLSWLLSFSPILAFWEIIKKHLQADGNGR